MAGCYFHRARLSHTHSTAHRVISNRSARSIKKVFIAPSLNSSTKIIFSSNFYGIFSVGNSVVDFSRSLIIWGCLLVEINKSSRFPSERCVIIQPELTIKKAFYCSLSPLLALSFSKRYEEKFKSKTTVKLRRNALVKVLRIIHASLESPINAM
jgi:hypothetical protein